MLTGLLASLIESVGDYHACARLSGAPPPPKHAMNRGIAAEGIGVFVAGAFGCGIDTTAYGENIGAIGITKVKTGPLSVWKLLFYCTVKLISIISLLACNLVFHSHLFRLEVFAWSKLAPFCFWSSACLVNLVRCLWPFQTLSLVEFSWSCLEWSLLLESRICNMLTWIPPGTCSLLVFLSYLDWLFRITWVIIWTQFRQVWITWHYKR